VARVALLDLPAGAVPRDYVRFRLGPSLPWPASEAIVEVLPAGTGRVVGAAVRRSVVAEYEQVAAGAGLEVERVHLAPLLALEGLLRPGAPDAVHAVLGDVALFLATIHGGALVALRSRRRDASPDEAVRLRRDAERAAASNGSAPPLSGSPGPGPAGCSASSARGTPGGGLPGPGSWPGADEAAWLGGLVA
jgi:hypothetical protein